MIKILLVHQSESKMNTIKSIIRTNIHDVVIYTADSGTLALEMIKKEKPDIVFLTIELVDVSGIDIADEVMEFKNHPEIVFVSQYDYFEFVRKSLQLAIADYLLEPVTEHDIIEVVERLTDKIRKDREYEVERKAKKELMGKLHELAGVSFAYMAIFADKTGKKLEEYASVLKLSEKGMWVCVEFEKKAFDVEIDEHRIESTINNALSEYTFIIGPKIINKIPIYISVKEDEYKTGEDMYTLRITNRLRTFMEKEYTQKIRIGSGSIQKLDRLFVSYEESIRESNRKMDKEYGMSEIPVLNKKKILETERKLLESIELGKDDVTDLVETLLASFSMLSVKERKNKVIEMLIMAHHTALEIDNEEDDEVSSMSLLEELLRIEPDEIDSWALTKFYIIIKSVRNRESNNMSETVKTAIYYIHEHYSENISLNDIAGMVGLSLQYFSKLFKDETGYNYVEWLNNLRITKAKELMNTTQLTIKEICFKVGYNDPNYFSRIFKKYEGIAPTEFINNISVNGAQ